MSRILLPLILVSFFLSCVETKESNRTISQSVTRASEGVDVKAMVVKSQDFRNQIVSNGRIEARAQSDLRFKTGEQIVKIYVHNGSKVQEGEIIAELENELLENQLKRAIINFKDSEREVINHKILYGVNGLDEHDIDPNVLENIYQKSGYRSAKNALENAKLLYNQTFLRAPFSGVIANLDLKEGNFINPSDKFCTILSYEYLDVTFHVLESHLQSLKKYMEVEIIPFSSNKLSFKGKITEINPMVSDNGLVKIKAEINQPNSKIFDGMNVKVYINSVLSDVTVIPKEALVIRDNREVVFTIKKGLAQWNYVEIISENSSSYAIETANKGLREGDSIVTSGNLNLTQNSKVQISLPN